MKKAIYILGFIAISTTLYSCFKNPVTGRSSLNLADESTMRQEASVAYSSQLAQHQVVTGTAQAQMINKVGQKISAAVAQYLQSRGQQDLIKGYNWQFTLLQSNEVNAWCMPGGKVAFYTGILPIAQDEKGVAVVMGHEIAHAIARHGNERVSNTMVAQYGGAVFSTLMNNKSETAKNIFNQAYGIGSNLGILAYSRQHETEADEMGLIFMAMAGYDPHEAIGFWQRMAAQGGAKPPEFLSTHPSDQRRINDIKGRISEAMKYYKPQ